MKLLMVDDQAYVLQGLCQGIDWPSQGFDKVFTARNALEARQILNAHSIDVMLCDIEMPFENGLSLIRWLRDHKMRTRCILLTAHPDFSYAREAIPLDVTDYVVQPAPYSEVMKAVQKAVKELNEQIQQVTMQRLGENVDKSYELLVSTALGSWLLGHQRAAYTHILSLGDERLPDFSQKACLALLSITRWENGTGWENGTMLYALNNILTELFAPHKQRVCLAETEEDRYACLIWGAKPELAEDLYVQQFEFLRSVFKNYFQAEIATYLERNIPITQLPELFIQLQNLDSANIARYSLVQTLTAANDKASAEPKLDDAGRRERVTAYQAMLERGMTAELLTHLNAQLDKLIAAGAMSLSTLRIFRQDFSQALYGAASRTGVDPHTFLDTQDGRAFYHNALHSLPEMRAFLQYVCEKYTAEKDMPNASHIAAQAAAYIERNLDRTLRRKEVAAQIHVSEGYLSRVFRKEMGTSLKEYITEQKMQLARSLLRSTSLPVSLVAMRVGYSNFSLFAQSYRIRFGRSPSAERKMAELGEVSEQGEQNET